MALFLVVNHRKDSDQPWVNRWIDSDRLRAITTTTEIAARCSLAKLRGERVYVHRCGLAGSAPMICCSVDVKNAGRDDDIGWVEFRDCSVIGIAAERAVERGETFYDAEPPAAAPPAAAR